MGDLPCCVLYTVQYVHPHDAEISRDAVAGLGRAEAVMRAFLVEQLGATPTEARRRLRIDDSGKRVRGTMARMGIISVDISFASVSSFHVK
jgi:transcriptional regulator GlxA family with amidase domain